MLQMWISFPNFTEIRGRSNLKVKDWEKNYPAQRFASTLDKIFIPNKNDDLQIEKKKISRKYSEILAMVWLALFCMEERVYISDGLWTAYLNNLSRGE